MNKYPNYNLLRIEVKSNRILYRPLIFKDVLKVFYKTGKGVKEGVFRPNSDPSGLENLKEIRGLVEIVDFWAFQKVELREEEISDFLIHSFAGFSGNLN